MLSLLSPAKKLLNSWAPYTGVSSTPRLLKQSSELATLMKTKSVADIAKLMDVSQDLATLNFDRFQRLDLKNQDPSIVYPAVLLFQGDVYQGLQAKLWDNSTLEYAQQHLGILSGFYGLLKPLDLIAPYRLEMGTKLANSRGANLYDYWRIALAQCIEEQLKQQSNSVIINLASSEYFNAVDTKSLHYPVVTINFYEQRNGTLKMIGIFAKKARGAMASFMMQHRIDTVEDIKNFNGLGYVFNPKSSSAQHLDFIRE